MAKQSGPRGHRGVHGVAVEERAMNGPLVMLHAIATGLTICSGVFFLFIDGKQSEGLFAMGVAMYMSWHFLKELFGLFGK